MLNVSILFQSRTASISAAATSTSSEYCPPDQVFLSSIDIRALRCRVGSFIAIQLPDEGGHSRSLLCRVWPSQKMLGNGRATLNRMWWPNFPTNQNARSATLVRDVGQFCMIKCTVATLVVHGNGDGGNSPWESAAKSPIFASYVISCVEHVPLESGIVLGFTWKGHACLVTLRELLGPAGEQEVGEGCAGTRLRRYLIDFSTSISFVQEGDDQCESGISSKGASEAAGEGKKFANLFSFAGYGSQYDAALHLTRLGLLLGAGGQRLAQLGSTASATSTAVSNEGRRSASSLLTMQLFKPPRGLLIHGPPGTGKSTLIKTLVRSLGCASIEISYLILQHKFVGEAEMELQRVFQYASTHAPCCVLMDDADLLCKSRSDSQTSHLQRRIVSCLLSLLDGIKGDSGTGVFVIAATTHPNSIDAAFRRPGRFDKEIEIGVPNAAEREAILTALVEDSKQLLLQMQGEAAGTSASSSAVRIEITPHGIGKVASQAHGMVGADLLQVLKEAQLVALYKKPSLTTTLAADSVACLTESLHDLSLSHSDPSGVNVITVTDDDLLQALPRVPPSALREIVVEIPTVYWSDIGGMDSVKQSLREVVEWPLLYPQLFASFAVHPPRGVLLYGPPGCSKTLMAKALATEGGMNFLTVRGPELLSKWLGESEKAVQTLFRRARAAAPSVVFFDEIDALAGKRGGSSAGVNDRVLAQLLSELDGIQSSKDSQRVIVVAATNRPDMLDAALIRPGRIDRKVYVPPPDKLSREQIFRLELRKVPTASDINLSFLTELSDGFSGAEVVAVCTEAAMLAMDEGRDDISQDLLEKVAKSITPQITANMLQFYAQLKF